MTEAEFDLLMKFPTGMRAIPITSELQTIFDRYDVKLRRKNSMVEHEAYGTVTEVTPSVFAVYQTAITALALHTSLNLKTLTDPKLISFAMESEAWHYHIARKDGFQLVIPSKTKVTAKQAFADYAACSRLISEVGLKYELLD